MSRRTTKPISVCILEDAKCYLTITFLLFLDITTVPNLCASDGMFLNACRMVRRNIYHTAHIISKIVNLTFIQCRVWFLALIQRPVSSKMEEKVPASEMSFLLVACPRTDVPNRTNTVWIRIVTWIWWASASMYGTHCILNVQTAQMRTVVLLMLNIICMLLLERKGFQRVYFLRVRLGNLPKTGLHPGWKELCFAP